MSTGFQPQITATHPAPDEPSAAHTKQAWTMIWVWSVFLALMLLARGGKLLIPLFPIGSVGVGLFLYFRTPSLYIGYTWWYCFLGALIRRIIDQQSGYITPGRWGLVSMLVASISIITLFRHLPKAYRDGGGLPFIMSAMGVLYAFAVGIIFGSHSTQYMVVLFEWLGPVAFGFHLFFHWKQYPANRRVIERTFVWGVLFMGVYGIVQFCLAPDWDRFYLNNLAATSFGQPFPFQIRVFSSLGSPQGFATVMMAGLLLLFGSESVIRFPASAAGYLSFLLSMARSGWVAWVFGVATFVPFLKPRFQMRFVVTVLAMAILVVPIVSLEPFSEGIGERLQTLTNPQDDGSFQGRSEGYGDALSLALQEVTGGGLGSGGPVTALGGSDSGILPLFFAFGWIGVIPYAGGLLAITLQLLHSNDKGQDTFNGAARAIVLGTLAQVWANNVFSDAFGLVLWGFLGISLAAQQYYSITHIR